MKVAYVISSLQKPSGWRSHARDFLGALRDKVEAVLFVAADEQKEAAELFPWLPVFPLPVTQAASFGSRSGLSRLMATYSTVRKGPCPQVDLVHSLEAYPTGLVGLWLARRMGCPHVLTAHGTYAVIWRARPLDRVVYSWVLRRTALICPVSTGTARLMKEHFGAAIDEARLRPVLNGNNFHRKVPVLQGERPLPEIPTLLSVGEVKPRKGQDISLKAFARVQAELPEARYWIVGRYSDNSYYQEMQAFIEKQGLRNVEFLGAAPDEELSRCYRQASLFVLTPRQVGYRFEGFGLVYLEAGAYYLPVVAADSGGTRDAVVDGETGFLVSEGDVDAAAEAILRLLRDPALNRRMGKANRLRAETLTWERTAQEQVQAYRELLGR